MKDLQKLYDSDATYKRLTVQVYLLQSALSEIENSSKSKPSEILQEITDTGIELPDNYKNIKFKNKSELITKITKDISQLNNDINTRLKELDTDLANKSGFLDPSKAIDVLTKINATGTRNALSIILGNPKNEVSITENKIAQMMRSMHTTLLFKPNNTTAKTKKGDVLNAIENISDNKEIEDYSNKDDPTQMVGAALLYKKVDNFYHQQNLPDNYNLQTGLTEDERSIVEQAIESNKPWLISDENNISMIQSEFLPNVSNLGVDTLELLITAAYVGVKAGNINKRNLINYLQNVFKQVFGTQTLTKDFIRSIDLVVNKVVDFNSDILKKAQAKIDEYLEFDDEAELIFKLNRKYSKQLQKGDIKYSLSTPQGRAEANKQLAEKAKQKQLDKPKNTARMAKTVKKVVAGKNAIASFSKNSEIIKNNSTIVETEIAGGLKASEIVYTKKQITPEEAVIVQDVAEEFEEKQTTNDDDIMENAVKSFFDIINRPKNDAKLQSNFLDPHKYGGTVDPYKNVNKRMGFINPDSITINDLRNFLANINKSPDITKPMFMEILYKIIVKLTTFNYFDNVNQMSFPGVNNTVISNTIINLIYS
jgi:hypothetical protein